MRDLNLNQFPAFERDVGPESADTGLIADDLDKD